MKNSFLVFIPTGLNSPELEVLVAHAQNLIDKKKKVTILTCGGGKNYRCSKNLFSVNILCSLCKFKRENLLKKIKGNFEYIKTPHIKNQEIKKNIKNFNQLKKYNYKGLDNGLAAYSSYLDLARDKDLKGKYANKVISGLIHTSNSLSDFYIKLIKNKKFTDLICFNSRMNLYRPLFRACSKLNVKLNNLETTHDGKKLIVHNFKKSLVNDYDELPKLINANWNLKTKLNKKKLTDRFYVNVKKFTSHMENPSGFLLSQKQNLLPKGWSQNKFNICFFASSEDEYESIVKKHDDSIFKSQLDSILEVAKIIKNKNDFCLYVRMHPNLDSVKWSYVTDINNLNGKYENLKIIEANSPVSTHAIMQASNLILGLRSRTLLESTYMNKPTIILGRSYWDSLGPFLKIKNRDQLKDMILSKKVKCLGKLAARKYAYFWLTSGGPLKNVKGNYRWSKDKKVVKTDFKFKNYDVSFSRIQTLLYYLCKIYEKFFLYLNYKLSKK